MFFIPYDQWMEKTRSRLSSRSPALKNLDSALAEAEKVSEDDANILEWFQGGVGAMSPAAKAALEIEKARRGDAVTLVRRAFNAWVQDQTKKGQDWRKSVRNECGAVQTLCDQIGYWTRTFPNESERAALDFIIAERNKSIPVLFKGSDVVIYSDASTKKDDATTMYKAATVAINSRKLARGSSSGGAGAGGRFMQAISSEADKLVTEAFGAPITSLVWDPAENVLKTTLDHAFAAIKDEIAALAPGVGLAAASATMVFNAVKLITQSIAADAMLDLSKRLEAGDSRSAMLRVRDWQLRAIAARTAKVARAGVNVGMHSASIASCGAGIPAQLAVSIASGIIALAAAIGELGMQYKEKRALAAYLNRDNLGRDIFAQAPLAAAYYLLNTPTSHIALQVVEFGAPTWRQDVELLQKDGVLASTLSESANLISAARYRIKKKSEGSYRERVDKSLLDKAKVKLSGSK
jgi:hypothetical protein